MMGTTVLAVAGTSQCVAPEIAFFEEFEDRNLIWNFEPRDIHLDYSYDLWGTGVMLYNTFARLERKEEFLFYKSTHQLLLMQTNEEKAQTHLDEKIAALDGNNFAHIPTFAKQVTKAGILTLEMPRTSPF